MVLFVYYLVLLVAIKISRGDPTTSIIRTSENRNFIVPKLVFGEKLEVKVPELDVSNLKTVNRTGHGRQLVFLPFFNRPHRPRITSFRRRIGSSEFHPLRKYCFYDIYRYRLK
ncbi:hypothetical protein HHI36_000961 [Cryptolaemus montrouzieri]|uniref:Uncharacterized protein n=1 Tax=Cryptolaemus montrouzieri TaxID=559131 RepID=A0ABD2P6E5_9CUCU